MQHGICNISVVPIRKEPADQSEIISQLLFGEIFEVLGKDRQWVRIKCTLDGYEGWIDEKQFVPTDPKFVAESNSNNAFSLEILQSAISRDNHIPILLGSTLPLYDGMNFRINKEKFIFNGQAYAPNVMNHREAILEKVALKYLNAPYLWGGRSPFGIDCSGFVQVVYKILGINLLRDTYQQAEQGYTINFVEDARAGDLAFFTNEAGRIAHVGIIQKDKQIIHAWGKVRMDTIDHYGIYNKGLQKYTHKLRIIKRML